MAKVIKVKKVLPKKHTKRWLLFFLLIPILIVVGLLYFFILRDLPSPTTLSNASLAQSTKIYDRNGKLTLYDLF